MENKFKKVMVLLISVIIQTSVFATGSIAIDGHILSVDFQTEDYNIQSVVVKSSNGLSILYQSQGCHLTLCSYNVGAELGTWGEIWVRTDHGTFRFNKI